MYDKRRIAALGHLVILSDSAIQPHSIYTDLYYIAPLAQILWIPNKNNALSFMVNNEFIFRTFSVVR